MNDTMKELVKRFPDRLIKDDGRGNSYVPHSYVIQRIIHIYGVPPKIEILRELYDEGKLTGVVMRMTVPGLEPVEEAGEADNPQSKTNGARAKDAASDAVKRCAMRLGLGLHLWAQENYYLDTLEESQASPPPSEEQPSPGQGATPEAQAEDGKTAPSSGEVSDPSSEPPPWFTEYVDKYGPEAFCKAATKFAKSGAVVTDPATTKAATKKQRDSIISELTADEWAAPEKASA